MRSTSNSRARAVQSKRIRQDSGDLSDDKQQDTYIDRPCRPRSISHDSQKERKEREFQSDVQDLFKKCSLGISTKVADTIETFGKTSLIME